MTVDATAKYAYVPVAAAPADSGESGLRSPAAGGEEASSQRPRLYRRRWLMLAIFVLFSLSNSSQWIQYSIVSNVVQGYYGVSSLAVDWTSIVYMILYGPLVLPAAAFMDYMGVRKGLLVGAAVNALGAWIKCASVEPSRFAVAMVGQTVVAAAQIFILSVPPQLANAWFGAKEIATACALGVFGNMLGIAAGFVMTPLLVGSRERPEEVQRDLQRLFYVNAAYTTLVFLLIAALFQERPPAPPTAAAAVRAPVRPGCLAPLRRLLRQPSFCLLTGACAINVGAVCALSTLLNQLVLLYHKDGEAFAGRLGLLCIVGSMVGSVAYGIILDRTHRYKEASLALFALSLLAMLAFTFALPARSQPLLYAAVAAVGCFLGGYMPVGLEFASELTYPESETATAGVLLGAAQLLGVAFTLAYGWLLEAAGDVWANLALSATLVLGAALSALIRPDLRRQAALASSHPPRGPALSDSASDSTDGTDVDDRLSSPPGSPPPYSP